MLLRATLSLVVAACLLRSSHGQTSCLAGQGLQISDRNAGQACPAADDGNVKMVMSGFTEATDTSFNGIYTMLPANKIICRNISGELTDASCTDVCRSDTGKCIGDAGMKEYDQSFNQVTKPFGLGAVYYTEDRLVFLSYMGTSPKWFESGSTKEKTNRTADATAAPTIPGTNPIWFACKYSLSTFLDKLSWPSSSASSTGGMAPMAPAAASHRRRLLQMPPMTGTGGTSAPMYGGMGGVDEGGLNTGAANMLADCKATAMGVEGEPSVPVVGPDGWIRFGVGTAPYDTMYVAQDYAAMMETMMGDTGGMDMGYGPAPAPGTDTGAATGPMGPADTGGSTAPAPGAAASTEPACCAAMTCSAADSALCGTADGSSASSATGTVVTGGTCATTADCMTSSDICTAMVCTADFGTHRRRLLSANCYELTAANCRSDCNPCECQGPAVGEIDKCMMQSKMVQTLVTDVVDPANQPQYFDIAVDVGCPGAGCIDCTNGEYSAETDLTCLQCSSGTRGTGASKAVSEVSGCENCPVKTAQPLRGQADCDTCVAGADSTDKLRCACATGHKRACSGEATEAIVTGLPEGDGTYVLSEKIMGKPVFKASVVSGLETKEYVMQYNNSFLEWQIYKRFAKVDKDGNKLDAFGNKISASGMDPVFYKHFLYFYYGRLADVAFPPSGKWLYAPDAKQLAKSIDNIVIDCNTFSCNKCEIDTFNQLPSSETCTACPVNMDTKGAIGLANRRECSCMLGYVGACSDDLEVNGHSNSFFNGVYKKSEPVDWALQTTFKEKPFFKGDYLEIFYGEDQIKAKDMAGELIPCAGRWYFGEIAMSNQSYCNNCKASHGNPAPYSFKAQCKQEKDPASNNKLKALDMSQSQKDKESEDIERAGEKCMSIYQKAYMHYTLVSACTDSNLPPSGPGWFDHRTNVKLNLLTVDCRADTTCELCTGGMFSDLAQTKCMDCPEGADCRDGQLFIGDQFWVHTTGDSPAAAGSSNSTVTATLLSADDSSDEAMNISLDENTTLYKCIHRGACQGDSKTALNFTCREGHIDRLCGICAEDYNMNAGVCEPCPGGGADGTYVIFLTALVVLFIILTIGGACLGRRFEKKLDPVTGQPIAAKKKTDASEDGEKLEGAEKPKKKGGIGSFKKFKKVGGKGAGNKVKALLNAGAVNVGQAPSLKRQGTSVGGASVDVNVGGAGGNPFEGIGEKLKIAVAYAQVNRLFYDQLSIPWPSEVTWLFTCMAYLNFDFFSMFSVGCVAVNFYKQFVAVMMIPAGLCIMALIVHRVGDMFVKARVIKTVWRGFVAHKLSVALFLVYPTISKTCLQMYAFYGGGTPIEGEMYLAADLRIAASDPYYLWFASLAAVFVVLYVIGIPGFFCYLLYLNSATLEECKMEDKQAKHLDAIDQAECDDLAKIAEENGEEEYEVQAAGRPHLVFTKFLSDSEQEVQLCLVDVPTHFSPLDVTMYETFSLQSDGDKVKVRRHDNDQIVEVQWFEDRDHKSRFGGKPPQDKVEESHKEALTILQVSGLKSSVATIDGVVLLSNGYAFKNPALDKPTMVKAVRLWGTEYKPSKWLAEPTDINVWSEESNAEVIKVIQGPSWKGVEHEDTYIHGEWTVELDNGCIFENPAQGRDYTRVSAAVASLGWLGQAYETQFWYWEMIEFTRKLVLSAVVVFVKPNSSVQILTAIFVCIIFLGLVSYFKPYEEDDDDTFAFISYICLVFTLVLGVGLRSAAYEKQTPAETTLFAFLMLFVNLIVFFLLLQVIIEMATGKKLSDCTKKCRRMCRRKRKAVDLSLLNPEQRRDNDTALLETAQS